MLRDKLVIRKNIWRNIPSFDVRYLVKTVGLIQFRKPPNILAISCVLRFLRVERFISLIFLILLQIYQRVF